MFGNITNTELSPSSGGLLEYEILTFLPGPVPDNAESPLANFFSLVHFDIKLKVKIRHRWEKVDRRSLTFLGSSALKQ